MGLPSQLGSDSVKFMFHIFGEGQDGCEEEVVPSVTSFEVGDLGVSPQRTDMICPSVRVLMGGWSNVSRAC